MLQVILLLLFASCDTALSGPTFHQLISHQACVETPLLEVQITVYTSLDLPGLTGDQCLGQYHMGKYEGLFGVPLPAEYLQPLCSQYCSEPEPYLTGVCGIPDS